MCAGGILCSRRIARTQPQGRTPLDAPAPEPRPPNLDVCPLDIRVCLFGVCSWTMKRAVHKARESAFENAFGTNLLGLALHF